MSNRIEISELTHRYGERVALDHVDLSIEPEEFFGIVGPNGGGKSTLFKILSTLIVPSSGVVTVGGHNVVSTPSEVRKLIGVVFQSPALDKKLSVAENLWAEGRLHGIGGSELKEEIERLSGRFGLSERRNDRVEKLSGGLKRRVEIARSLIHRPKILLLDEPTTGLDPLARREVWDLIWELQKSQRLTVVLTTHLLEEAERCHRVCLLSEGKVIALGAPGELRDSDEKEVLWIKGAALPELAVNIKQRFGIETSIVDGEVRLEASKGHELVAPLMSAFGSGVESVRVGRATLEDFFIRKTGSRFSSAGVSRA